MGRIYREAARVLIWLGDEDENTGLAWSCIRLIRREQEMPTSRAYQALKDILDRDWFHRAWTYQESVLATRAEIFCGSHQIRREHLASIFLPADEPKYSGVADLKFLRGEYVGILMNLLELGRPGTLDLNGSPFCRQRTYDSRKLRLRGVTVDTIVTLENPTNSSLINSSLGTGGVYEYADYGMGEAFIRNLVADINPSDHGTKEGRWTEEDFVKSANEDGFALFWARAHMKTSNRSFFRTQDRRIGLAPITAREGDLVCLVLGGEVPFVLRRSDDEYELVGECYVHGLMDGEGLVEAARRTQPGFDCGMLPRLYEWDEEPLPFEVEEFVLK